MQQDLKTIYKYSWTPNIDTKLKIKNIIDVSHALAGAVLLAPLMAIVAVAIKIDSPGPVVFKQERIGLNGKMFTIYKFRTMYVDNKSDERVKSDSDERITKTGKILRKYSLDEIPQIFNIINGDMSLVGPRPLRKKVYNEIISECPEYEFRINVKPGLRLDVNRMAGGAGAYMAPIEREYIENWSLIKDFKIFWSIIGDSFRGKNY